MVRPLLLHEQKAIEILLHDFGLQVPTESIDLFVPIGLRKSRTLRVNAPFTLFFQRHADSDCLRKVASAPCLPTMFGSSLFLVENNTSHQLAFLELTPESEPEMTVVERYVRFVDRFISNFRLDDEAASIAEEVVKVICQEADCRSPVKSRIREIRLWDLGQCTCFCFCTSDELLRNVSASTNTYTAANGKLQVLRSTSKCIGIDGWCVGSPAA